MVTARFRQYFACGLLLLSPLFLSVETAFASDGRNFVQPEAGLVKEVEFPEGLSSAQSIEIDATGRVWFIEQVGKQLVVFDPATEQFNIFALPDSWGNVGFSKMTMSPDGEIWFTVNRWVKSGEESNMLGRFTPSDGYFTRYVLSIDAYPDEIMVDAKGVIWFSAANKNSLYRVDPVKFSIKGYAIPASNSYPNSLSSDKNGHIWFSESSANKIGKFIPEKEVFYEYTVPTAFANPGKISIDQSGRIWFVEVAANRIGVFYPDLQRFDEAIIPTANSAPSALVHDNDGNVWFLEYRGNKVGFFNPKLAVFHEFDIPNFSSRPGALAIDRRRSMLWFTQSATEAKRLGSLSISEAMAKSGK
jgi:streptogramin lyase